MKSEQSQKCTIIDGLGLSSKLEILLKQIVSYSSTKLNRSIDMSIIFVGNNNASEIYVNKKIQAAKRIGINPNLIRFPQNITEKDLIMQIKLLNADKKIKAIIVQLPLPEVIDRNKVLLALDPEKDIDGLHPFNSGLLHCCQKINYELSMCGQIQIEKDLLYYEDIYNQFKSVAKNLGVSSPFIPCTPLGCLYLIKSIKDNIESSSSVIIGNSNLVGKPLERLLLLSGSSTSVLHSKSKNIEYYIKNADIIALAAGAKKNLLQPTFVKDGAIIIDIAINIMNNKIYGDTDHKCFINKNCSITPVPKGVGPMTVVSLMFNAILANLK
jgi:methylenetetrahydrofolate dehydrogenase (NADP+)/methenyltetrahydrofolate cyclohydrolase